MSDLYPSGGPPDLLVLAGLADIIISHWHDTLNCAHCRTLAAPCLTHQPGAELAADCHAAYLHELRGTR